jgi:hypothetical protein
MSRSTNGDVGIVGGREKPRRIDKVSNLCFDYSSSVLISLPGLVVKRLRLLCCSARSYSQKHDRAIDPSDFRRSKTVRCMCPAQVNTRLNRDGLYRLTVVQLEHNHAAFFEDDLPEYKPPTEAQKEFVGQMAVLKSVTRRDIQTLLSLHFPEHPLNPTQVSNLIDETR